MQGTNLSLYHVCTNGLAQNKWFRDEEDFIAGMNNIPACGMSAGVRVYCFCLMSNHVHFILEGSQERCSLFIREYKRRQSRLLTVKYRKPDPLADGEICIKSLDTFDYIKSAIAYVVRNPTAAGLPVTPEGYPWSSAAVYFSQQCIPAGARRFAEIPITRRAMILKSKMAFPDDYLIDSKGMILPQCYVEYKSVENIYGNPKQWMYYLSSTQDLKLELETGIISKTGHSDIELSASLDALSEEKFKGRRFQDLKLEDRYLIAKELKKRYGAGVRQLARITSLNPELLKALM